MTLSTEDRFDLLDLLARYNYYAEEGPPESWSGLFTDDGCFSGPPGEFRGTAELTQFCRELLENGPTRMYFTDHHLFEPTEDGVLHRCMVSLQVKTEDGVQILLAHYDGEMVREDSGWKFRSRTFKFLEA
jgi:hypothetical protein